MTHQHANAYRRRATHLRALAHDMTHTPALSLHRHAGVDVWRGPLVHECMADLAAAQRNMFRAIDELGDRAWQFDRIADELESAAWTAERERRSAEGAPAPRIR